MPELAYALDVADGQRDRLGSLIDLHKPQHVVMHAYIQGERPPFSVTRDEVSVCGEKGVTSGFYFWGFPSFDPVQSVQSAVSRIRGLGLEPPVLWVDCERYSASEGAPGVDWLHAAGSQLDNLGVRKGLYVSPSVADEFWGERAWELQDWLLWLASWDEIPQLTSSYLPLYGWTWLAGKQWSDPVKTGTNVDRDIFLPEYTVVVSEPTPPTPPAPTDELAVAEWKIENLRIALDDVGYKRLGEHLVKLADAGVTDGELFKIRDELRRIRTDTLGEK